MSLLLNRAKASCNAAGTGAVTPGAGIAPARSWSSAGAQSGFYYPYLIEQASGGWETGTGLYNGTTITRPGPGVDPTFDSSNGTGGPLVTVTAADTIACIDIRDIYPTDSPDARPVPANVADDEFDFGTALDTTGSRRPGATAWTWLTAAGSTSISQGNLNLQLTAGTPFRCFDQPVSGSTFKYRSKFSYALPLIGGAGNQIWQGIYFRRGTNALIFDREFNGAYNSYCVGRWTNLITPSWSSNPSSASYNTDQYGPIRHAQYYQIEWDGTNVTFKLGATGYDNGFNQVYSETGAAFLGGAPQFVGLLGYAGNAPATQNFGFDYFRKVG